jgi:hypothetical protein
VAPFDPSISETMYIRATSYAGRKFHKENLKKINFKIRLEIKIQHFRFQPHIDPPLYLENGKCQKGSNSFKKV